MQLGVSYDPAAPDDPKRQLDLYLPGGRDFPIVVFVHGGGWAWGDRTQSFGGADVYRNIGRFLASQGIGAAVIGYRLLWPMDWQSQVGDVARAVAWVQAHAAEHGGQPNRDLPDGPFRRRATGGTRGHRPGVAGPGARRAWPASAAWWR